MVPVPMNENAGWSRIACRSGPPSSRADPRTMLSIASVTMIGGSPSHAIRLPFSRPMAKPSPSASSNASGSPSPASSDSTATNPDSASTGPIDRSMPPVMMTKVIPAPMMPTIATWRRMPTRFSGLRNAGCTQANSATNATPASGKPEANHPRQRGPRCARMASALTARWSAGDAACRCVSCRHRPEIAHQVGRARAFGRAHAHNAALGHHHDAIGDRRSPPPGRRRRRESPCPRPAQRAGWRRSRPWHRRRHRPSARRGSARAAAVCSHLPSSTFCWLPPDSSRTGFVGSGGCRFNAAIQRCAVARTRAASNSRPPRECRFSVARIRFSAVDRLSIRPSRWRSSGTKPMPRAIASRGERNATALAIDLQRAGVEAVGAEDRLHQLGAL